jgi:hypothetical protein
MDKKVHLGKMDLFVHFEKVGPFCTSSYSYCKTVIFSIPTSPTHTQQHKTIIPTHLSPVLSFPQTDAGKFPNITATKRDQLLVDLLAAAASRERAITEASHDDGARSWGRWQKWCKSIGCNDLYLDQFSQIKQNLLLGAFAMAVREGRFSLNHSDALVEGTIRGAISQVVQAFWESGRQNPTKDADNMLSVLLSRQFMSYRNEIPKKCNKRPFLSLSSKN